MQLVRWKNRWDFYRNAPTLSQLLVQDLEGLKRPSKPKWNKLHLFFVTVIVIVFAFCLFLFLRVCVYSCGCVFLYMYLSFLVIWSSCLAFPWTFSMTCLTNPNPNTLLLSPHTWTLTLALTLTLILTLTQVKKNFVANFHLPYKFSQKRETSFLFALRCNIQNMSLNLSLCVSSFTYKTWVTKTCLGSYVFECSAPSLLVFVAVFRFVSFSGHVNIRDVNTRFCMHSVLFIWTISSWSVLNV